VAVLATAMALAQERRFAEAAACAMEAAEQVERQQPVSMVLYEHYASAGKFFHLAGQPRRGMQAFEKCIEVFEGVLAGQANVNFVLRHVATWPELFARASLTALEAGEAGRAVEFAECGRSRVMGALAAPVTVPAGVRAGEWHEYVRGWRRVAMRLASLNLQGRRPGKEETEAVRELTELARRLADSGVAPAALRPLSEAVQMEDAISLLRKQPVPTTIAYAITMDDKLLRLVAIDAGGAREVDLSPQEQGEILAAANRFRALEASKPGDLDRPLEDLLQSAGEALGAGLHRALENQVGGRLVWVPHGALVVVPIAALPCDGGRLIERVAIQVAPSLAMAMRALREIDANGSTAAAYIKGPWSEKARQAPTDGGETLLRGVWRIDFAQALPRSIQELAAVLSRRRLALFSCHGIFRWDEPATSYLQLGFDCNIDDLVGSGLFDPRSLAVLNSCDAGTVAQDATNEPVGLPIAMMAAGAATVVGPSAPVEAIAAVAFSFLFLRELSRRPSPEAVQEAVKFMRTITKEELRAMLEEIAHPFARYLQTGRLNDRFFKKAVDWAFFTHWGSAQTLSPGRA